MTSSSLQWQLFSVLIKTPKKDQRPRPRLGDLLRHLLSLPLSISLNLFLFDPLPPLPPSIAIDPFTCNATLLTKMFINSSSDFHLLFSERIQPLFRSSQQNPTILFFFSVYSMNLFLCSMINNKWQSEWKMLLQNARVFSEHKLQCTHNIFLVAVSCLRTNQFMEFIFVPETLVSLCWPFHCTRDAHCFEQPHTKKRMIAHIFHVRASREYNVCVCLCVCA